MRRLATSRMDISNYSRWCCPGLERTAELADGAPFQRKQGSALRPKSFAVGLAIRERGRIDRLCERNMHARLHPPRNPHERERIAILEQVETILAGRDLLGFHCTRLHDDEICAIVDGGLVPLSPELVAARVKKRVIAGDITEAGAAKLLSQHRAADENQRNLVHLETLKISGIWRLLRFWGGEALYGGHEEDPLIGPALRRIGSPSIVVSSVPLDQTLESIWPVSERFVARWLRQRRIRTDFPPEMEAYMSARLGPDRILKVLTHLDSDFVKLTRYRKWRLSITMKSEAARSWLARRCLAFCFL